MFYIKQHPSDKNMIDIMTISGGAAKTISIWATVYSDFFYDIDRDGIYEKLKTGEMIKVELKEVPE